MKFKILTAIILTFVFGAFYTAEAQTSQIKLQVGAQKKAFKNKLTVKFIQVLDDSRCPEDVNCVWAGNAKVQIKIRKGNGAWKTLEVNSSLAPQTVEFGGYEIKLVNLTPTPRSNIRINRNGYVATTPRKFLKNFALEWRIGFIYCGNNWTIKFFMFGIHQKIPKQLCAK